jgi:uncharacterized protein (DUF169 family)
MDKRTDFTGEKYMRFKEALALPEPPLVAYYTDEEPKEGIRPPKEGHWCIIGLLRRTRREHITAYFDSEHFGCGGGGYYMGFLETPRPKIEYFLSCGIPGEMEGERYIKTPERAREFFAHFQPPKAPARYCVFQPLDRLDKKQEPLVEIFFAPPDVLSGLVVLTSFALESTNAVSLPFSSGCGSILTLPLKEAAKERPGAVLGMFDVSARPFVEPDVLTLGMPHGIFLTLLDNVDESFLITESWQKIRRRISGTSRDE